MLSFFLPATFGGLLHWSHIATLFENDCHFSHLSTLEREMSFRTEMGFYYSFFKTLVEAPSFSDGIWMIIHDEVTEYPLVINSLKRFSLYPEVVLASWYRIYKGMMDIFGIPSKICWTVSRGQGLSPIESCEGLGDPACFYVAMILFLNGLMMTFFFIYGAYLSDYPLGGLIVVVCYFFNHGECTRVMWAPPLRENFSYPFLVLQMLLVTHILRTTSIQRGSLVALGIFNVLSMLPWQCAQFVLLIQIASLLPLYMLGYIDPYKLKKIIYVHLISLSICFALMFGNTKFLTSYFASSLVITLGLIAMRSKLLYMDVCERHSWAFQSCVWLFGIALLKFLVSLILDASNSICIIDLLLYKLFKSTHFDTLIYYSCAPEFDYMDKGTLGDIFYLSKRRTNLRKQRLDNAELIFHALQFLAYAVISVFIMKMKLFLTPHMCIMASLICSTQLFGWLFGKVRRENIVFGIIAAMSIQGWINLQSQWSIVRECSNEPQEELLMWINSSTHQGAVFAGTMPTMASVKLSAHRPIVNHPHYEDTGSRARMKTVYSMYSRKPAKEVQRQLLNLGVNYYVLEEAWCVVRTKPGCSMLEIWDVEDPANAGRAPLCNILIQDPRPHFIPVFQNNVYKVLKVTK
ncbi:probable C-mannosyltransferase DPY19L1 isoform X2 [Tachyglossus aculeatus]|uniref:probable C-mannosyltransferase DPY19L1 isoform X2 n=1 Tax=Tachyglossus aculeatus TaxID=9261 RepID=UPI0018F28733|nr:probable C-mannosyltransferase DPY19L1 isoform X2 [Tachyglossus aculeatus]